MKLCHADIAIISHWVTLAIRNIWMDTGEFLDRHFLPFSGAIQMDSLKGGRIKNMV